MHFDVFHQLFQDGERLSAVGGGNGGGKCNITHVEVADPVRNSDGHGSGALGDIMGHTLHHGRRIGVSLVLDVLDLAAHIVIAHCAYKCENRTCFGAGNEAVELVDVNRILGDVGLDDERVSLHALRPMLHRPRGVLVGMGVAARLRFSLDLPHVIGRGLFEAAVAMREVGNGMVAAAQLVDNVRKQRPDRIDGIRNAATRTRSIHHECLLAIYFDDPCYRARERRRRRPLRASTDIRLNPIESLDEQRQCALRCGIAWANARTARRQDDVGSCAHCLFNGGADVVFAVGNNRRPDHIH